MLTVTREDLGALEPEWRELLASHPAGHAAIFQSPTWLRTWWGEFGQTAAGPGAEGRELLLLSVREEGRLVGVVPLMREGQRLAFAGDTEVCDYMDFPCTSGREPELLSAMFRSLGEEPWEELSLWAVREDSPCLAALPSVTAAFGLAITSDIEDVCPQIALAADFEEYVSRLDKKDRHELRRKLRKLPQAGEVELEVIEAPAEAEAAIDEFLWMMRESRADKAEFMTSQMESFFRRIVVNLAREGRVELIFLKLGGKRTAAVLCFRAGDESLLWNSGYDPAYSHFSVGLLSKALALQRAIEQGKSRFDFLRGHERYKYELGAKDMHVHRVLIRREAGTGSVNQPVVNLVT